MRLVVHTNVYQKRSELALACVIQFVFQETGNYPGLTIPGRR